MKRPNLFPRIREYRDSWHDLLLQAGQEPRAAQAVINARLQTAAPGEVRNLQAVPEGGEEQPEVAERCAEALERFQDRLFDDLRVSRALAEVFGLLEPSTIRSSSMSTSSLR